MNRNALRNTSMAILLAIALTAVPGSTAWAQPNRVAASADSLFGFEAFGWWSALWTSVERFFGIEATESQLPAEKNGTQGSGTGQPVPPEGGTNNGDSGPLTDPDG